MNSRWYNIAVFILWISTMSWLVIQKILPTLVVGDPPDRVAILAGQNNDRLVGYQILWEGEAIGWSLVRAESLSGGSTLVDGQVRIERLPIRQFVPRVLQAFLGAENELPDHVPLDAASQLHFHPNGQLMRFDSSVSFDPTVPMVQIGGLFAGEDLVLTVRAGGASYETRRPLPVQAMVSDALMPQTRMPGLHEGRKWTVEVYSPFRPPTDPMEVMQAEVIGRDPIVWEGNAENAWLVVYRGDPGSDAGRAGKEHAWLWVRDDGVVLKHQVAMLNGKLTFVRMTTAECAALQRDLTRERSWLEKWKDPEQADLEGDGESEALQGEVGQP